MRRRAMSLLELLVVGGILVVLFGIVYSFLVPGLRAWTRSDAQSQAQQQCLLVVSFIT
ncbi:MAG: type II secretion system protein, partial [Armatimonadetes bacterium]|nr:type II secretion system protein [Armatimonadota bacterium]